MRERFVRCQTDANLSFSSSGVENICKYEWLRAVTALLRSHLSSPHSAFARTELAVYLGRSFRKCEDNCAMKRRARLRAHGNGENLNLCARRPRRPCTPSQRGRRLGGREGGPTHGGADLRIFSSPLLPDAKNVTVPHRSDYAPAASAAAPCNGGSCAAAGF